MAVLKCAQAMAEPRGSAARTSLRDIVGQTESRQGKAAGQEDVREVLLEGDGSDTGCSTGSVLSSPQRVVFLRWPAQSHERTRLRETGVPVLMVVEGSAIPPTDMALSEDWVRQPIPRCDIDARISTLLCRTTDAVPTLDATGVLYYQNESVPMSNAQVAMMQCFLTDFNRVVRREELQEALASIDLGLSNNALDLHILRLRKRIARINLKLQTVWGRGYILGWESLGWTVRRYPVLQNCGRCWTASGNTPSGCLLRLCAVRVVSDDLRGLRPRRSSRPSRTCSGRSAVP